MRADAGKERKKENKLGMVKGFLSRLFYIIRLVWETAPLLFVGMILLCLIDGVMPVVGSYITKYLLDGIQKLISEGLTSSGDFLTDVLDTLRPVLFLFIFQLIYQFAKRVLERLNSMVNVVAGEMVVNHIKLKIITKAKDVDQRSFDIPAFYEKLENANREASMRPINILIATFRVISAAISVVSFIVVLTTLNSWVPVIIIASAIPGAVVNYYYRKRNFRYMSRHSKDRRAMNYYSDLMVNKDYVKEIKILGLADTFIGKFKRVFKSYFKGLKRLVVRETLTRIVVSLIFTVASACLFVYVAHDVVFGDGLIGDYSLYTGALTSVASYVSVLVTSTGTIYEGTLFIDNMIEFMKEERTVVSTLPEPAYPSRGTPHTMELKNVSFAYPGTDRMVIKNLNLSFSSGDSVVLVGLNGAGKTTLIKLLTRLYDVTEGEILLDGRNIKEYSPEAYYDLFGIIFQDFGKYAETASENIEFGDADREHKREDVIAAAKSGNADSFVSSLPAGYDTPLTRMFEENGVELSGGQWQKLSVSRAFYKNSDILILDEPTASLDAIAEEEIFGQFSRLSEGKISIFVSHRLSSAVTAGKIVVLGDGELVELGTHEELMAKGGEYYRLFTTQAHRYTGESF
ncbi:MAG: ABC transporter ATP-binding protein [Clostridia bacterium]|nr:ABC transporter ATP-binding protein [Clostridia bacterium]